MMLKLACVLIISVLAIGLIGRTEDIQPEAKDLTVHLFPPKPNSHLQWSFRRALEACGLHAQFAPESFTFRMSGENRDALNIALVVLDERIQVLSTNMACSSLLGDAELRLMPYVRREVRVEDNKFSIVLDFSAPFTAGGDRSALQAHGHPLYLGTPVRPNIVLEDEAYELQRCLLVRRSIHDVLLGQQSVVRYQVREAFKEALQKPPSSVSFHKENGWTSTWLRVGETSGGK
jgi:hypothetical protein